MEIPENFKILLVVALLVFWALIALTASLPLNLPSRQYLKSYELLDPMYPDLNDGDTAWMIVATIFGFFLSPLVAYFYSLLHNKDRKKAVTMSIYNTVVVTTLWIIFSFSLCYGKDANGDKILGYPLTYYMFRNVGAAPSDSLAPTIPLSIFAVFELSFAILTPTLIGLSLLDRINIQGWMFFVFFWHLVVYCPIAHIVWYPQGWFLKHHIEDFSGGIVVNMLAGITAFASHVVLGPMSRDHVESKACDNKVFTGLIPVFIGWFAINAGKAHAANSIATQSIVNTIAGTAAAVFTWILFDMIQKRETTLVSFSNAILVALVALTPSSGYCTVGGAMCVTIFSVIFAYSFGLFVTKELENTKTPLSVITLHGVVGTFGFFMTAIFSYKFINENGFNGLTFGYGYTLAFHIAAIMLLVPSIFMSSYAVFFISNKVFPMAAVQTSESTAAVTKIEAPTNDV